MHNLFLFLHEDFSLSFGKIIFNPSGEVISGRATYNCLWENIGFVKKSLTCFKTYPQLSLTDAHCKINRYWKTQSKTAPGIRKTILELHPSPRMYEEKIIPIFTYHDA